MTDKSRMLIGSHRALDLVRQVTILDWNDELGAIARIRSPLRGATTLVELRVA